MVRGGWYRVEDAGRECGYSGEGNCGHAFKPWDEFYPGNSARGYESWCKACKGAYRANQPAEARERRMASLAAYHQTEAGKSVMRRAKLRYEFGISEEQYAKLLAEQGEVCFLCGEPETRLASSGKPTRLIPDHDHGCAAGHPPTRACPACIRGLLCHNCNSRVVPAAERSSCLAERFRDYLVRRPLLYSQEDERT